MKRIFICLMFYAFIISGLLPIEFNINKVNEFSISTYREYRGKNFIIDNPYLFTLTDYGLECYQIGTNGGLMLISRKPINKGRAFEMVGNHIFVGTRKEDHNPYGAKLYKIDVSDPFSPVIVQVFEFDNNVTQIDDIYIVNDHLLLSKWPPYHSIMNTDLGIVNENVFSVAQLIRFGFGENLILVENNAFNYLIYDFSDFDNISIVGSGDISSVHNFYGLFHYHIYQNTTLIISGQREMSFWDISDLNNWQLVYNIPIIEDDDLINYGLSFDIFDNYLFYLNPLCLVVFDLLNYSYHQVLHHDSYLSNGIDTVILDNNIYISTYWHGIRRFRFENDYFFYVEAISDYYANYRIEKSGDYCYVAGRYNAQGIMVFDISDPLNINEINRIEEGSRFIFYTVTDDYLVLRKFSGLDYEPVMEVYDVSDPQNPFLSSYIDLSPWPIESVQLTIDETEPSSIYLLLFGQMILLKFDISEPGEAILQFEYQLPVTISTNYIINNGILYLLTRRGSSYWHDLWIFDGLLVNDPYIQDVIEYFVFYDFPRLEFIGDYLSVCIGMPEYSYTTYYYSLSDPFYPIYAFSYNIPGNPFLDGEMLFQSASSTICVFDFTQDLAGIIYPFTYFANNGFASFMFFKETNGTNYLFAASFSNIGVYEYSYDLSTTEEVIEVPLRTSLSQNYPNPFNPETMIEFYLEKESKVKLEVFNIRGQRVAILENDILPEGKHSIVWKPIDQTGKTLPSGVYLYRLKTGDYSITRKMLYLK